MKLQLSQLFDKIDKVHQKHGDKNYTALYGAGCIKNPKVMFLFMNPTGKNLTTSKNWTGMRAPWIGLKNTWRFMAKLGIVDQAILHKIQSFKTHDWTPQFTQDLYSHVAQNKAYLTNLARCTQPDARHIPDIVFRESRDVTIHEISLVNPEIIISFGNQVSTHLLQIPIKVSEARKKRFNLVVKNKSFPVFPTYYPVGMGQRNMQKAITDIQAILDSN